MLSAVLLFVLQMCKAIPVRPAALTHMSDEEMMTDKLIDEFDTPPAS